MVMQLKAAQRQTIDRQVAKLRETRRHWSAEEHMEHAVKELVELQTKTMLAANEHSKTVAREKCLERGGARIDTVPMLPALDESTMTPGELNQWRRHRIMILALCTARSKALREHPMAADGVDYEADDQDDRSEMARAMDGHGCQLLARDLKQMHKWLWEEKLLNDARDEGYSWSFLPSPDFVRAVDEHPMTLNLSAIEEVFKLFPNLRATKYSHSRTTAVPSGGMVSKDRKLATDCALALFELDELQPDGTTTARAPTREPPPARLDDVPKHMWRVADAKKYIRVLLTSLGVDKIRTLGSYPYTIKLVNDGAPTTKHSGGCVTFTMTLCDPRTNEEIARSPQLPKYVFAMAAFFGGEKKETIKAAFMPLYTELRELETDGLDVNGTTVPIKFIHGNDLSNLWKGTEGCGGAIGTSTWPCNWCFFLPDLGRANGTPGGCTRCKERALALPTLLATPGGFATIARRRVTTVAARCSHFDMVHRSGDVLTKARDDAARITRELVADSVDGKWDANVRWPTPTLALARAELARRGIATSETTSDALANILDEAVEELAVTLPDGWDSAGVAVAEMSGRVVEYQLRLHKVRVPDGASNDAKRALLVGRLESLAMLKELTLVLQYPGIAPTSLYPDADRNTACVLHFEMRTGEKLIHELFSFPLARGYSDAHARIEAGVTRLRANTSWEHFALKYVANSRQTAIEEFSLTRAHAREIVRQLKEFVLPELVKAGDPPITKMVAGRGVVTMHPLAAWEEALEEYVAVVRALRYYPGKDGPDGSVIVGEPGYAAQLARDADALQLHADKSTNALVFLLTDTVITNYFHVMRAGHLRDMMLLHGYLAYTSNDAVEAINAIVNVLYHRHGQHGGSKGRDAVRPGATGTHTMADPTDAIRDWSIRKVGWACGAIDAMFKAHYAPSAVKGRAARDMTNAHAAAPGGRSAGYKEAHAAASAKRRKVAHVRSPLTPLCANGGSNLVPFAATPCAIAMASPPPTAMAI